MRNLLNRLFKGRRDPPDRSPTQTMIPGVLGVAGVREANPALLDVEANEVPAPRGEPAPVEADEDAWQREREQRERDGRS